MYDKSAGSADNNEKMLGKVVYNLFWPESIIRFATKFLNSVFEVFWDIRFYWKTNIPEQIELECRKIVKKTCLKKFYEVSIMVDKT